MTTALLAVVVIIAQLGSMLFLFLVGLELNLGSIRHRLALAGAISLAGVVLPLTLGRAWPSRWSLGNLL